MGASSAAAPISAISRIGDKGNNPILLNMFYVYWHDSSYPNGEYSGYQTSLENQIYGIPYKIGSNASSAIRFLNTSLACTKYIVIITGHKKKRIVKEISNSPAVIKIYIIKPFAEKLNKWIRPYKNLKVYREFTDLLIELKELLVPLDPIKELLINPQTDIEYLAYPNPITMTQQTINALTDEKAQQDDQLAYKTLYSLTLNFILNWYKSSPSRNLNENPFLFYFKADKSSIEISDNYFKLLKLSIKFDLYPLIVSGISIEEFRTVNLSIKKKELNSILSKLDDNIDEIDKEKLSKLHTALISILEKYFVKQYGSEWKSLYYPNMCLGDIDFCLKMFIQIVLNYGTTKLNDLMHKKFADTLRQASIASDIRISTFNDILERTKKDNNENNAESKSILNEDEIKIAKESCGVNNILLFDVNTAEYSNILAPLSSKVSKKCWVYKITSDFCVDFECQLKLRNKSIYVVIAAGFPKSEFEQLLNVFIRESISPILIVYIPNAIERNISKAMFKNKWIIPTMYAETFDSIVTYINDTEIDLEKEINYYSIIYKDFGKTLSNIRNLSEDKNSNGESKEYDAGFEVLDEINSSVFNGLVEELSLGTKLIGSLHYYMWKDYKELHKENTYWKNYASLFGASSKVMNQLDVNFGKNILRAYTLQEPPPFYKMLNDAFRGGNSDRISKFRGFYVILHDLIKKGILKYYCGTVFRGTYFNPSVIKELKPGRKIFSSCFTSTSKSPSVAREFVRKTGRNVLLEIELHPRGFSNVDIDTEKLSMYPEEQEVLLLPFTTLEIRSVSTEGDLTVVTINEALQEVEAVNLKGIDYYN